MEIVDPERALTLAYAPAASRPALAALWGLDERLAQVVASTRDERIGEIRLAWWREALEKLDTAPAPDEPVLQAVAAAILPAGVTGAVLGTVADGWAALLAEPLDAEAIEAHADQRGGTLFEAAGPLLGGESNALAAAGEGWALVDLAFHVRDPAVAAQAIELARGRLASAGERRWPRRLRPLGALAMLALEDAKRGAAAPRYPGSPRRMLRVLRHRLTGR